MRSSISNVALLSALLATVLPLAADDDMPLGGSSVGVATHGTGDNAAAKERSLGNEGKEGPAKLSDDNMSESARTEKSETAPPASATDAVDKDEHDVMPAPLGDDNDNGSGDASSAATTSTHPSRLRKQKLPGAAEAMHDNDSLSSLPALPLQLMNIDVMGEEAAATSADATDTGHSTSEKPTEQQKKHHTPSSLEKSSLLHENEVPSVDTGNNNNEDGNSDDATDDETANSKGDKFRLRDEEEELMVVEEAEPILPDKDDDVKSSFESDPISNISDADSTTLEADKFKGGEHQEEINDSPVQVDDVAASATDEVSDPSISPKAKDEEADSDLAIPAEQNDEGRTDSASEARKERNVMKDEDEDELDASNDDRESKDDYETSSLTNVVDNVDESAEQANGDLGPVAVAAADASSVVAEAEEVDSELEKEAVGDSIDAQLAQDVPQSTTDITSEEQPQKSESDADRREDKTDHGDDDDDDGPTERVTVDYANKSAGALILEKSPSMKGSSNLLNSDKDKYAIAPCHEKKFVVISLSEDILVKQVRLSNYERYSSQLKDFQILGSQTMGNWVDLGTYTALPGNGEQSFDLIEPAWSRYLKFRFVSHYGVEHYCTITQIKVHGSTMIQGFHEQWRESELEDDVLNDDGRDAEGGTETDRDMDESDRVEETISEEDKESVADGQRTEVAFEMDERTSGSEPEEGQVSQSDDDMRLAVGGNTPTSGTETSVESSEVENDESNGPSPKSIEINGNDGTPASSLPSEEDAVRPLEKVSSSVASDAARAEVAVAGEGPISTNSEVDTSPPVSDSYGGGRSSSDGGENAEKRESHDQLSEVPETVVEPEKSREDRNVSHEINSNKSTPAMMCNKAFSDETLSSDFFFSYIYEDLPEFLRPNEVDITGVLSSASIRTSSYKPCTSEKADSDTCTVMSQTSALHKSSYARVTDKVKAAVAEASDAIKSVKEASSVTDAVKGLQQIIRTKIRAVGADIDAADSSADHLSSKNAKEALRKGAPKEGVSSGVDDESSGDLRSGNTSDLSAHGAKSGGSKDSGEKEDADVSSLSHASDAQNSVLSKQSNTSGVEARKESVQDEPRAATSNSRDKSPVDKTASSDTKETKESHDAKVASSTSKERQHGTKDAPSSSSEHKDENRSKRTSKDTGTISEKGNKIPPKGGVSFNTEGTDPLLAALSQRIPSAKCMEMLNFADFKAKTIAGRPSTAGAGAPGGAGGPGKMEPIFKMLTDEIKTLQTHQAVYDQYLRSLEACYQRVILDMAKEIELLEITQSQRLSTLENVVKDIQARNQRGLLSETVVNLVTVLSASAAASFSRILSIVQDGTGKRSFNMAVGMVSVELTYLAAGGITILSLLLLHLIRRWAHRRVVRKSPDEKKSFHVDEPPRQTAAADNATTNTEIACTEQNDTSGAFAEDDRHYGKCEFRSPVGKKSPNPRKLSPAEDLTEDEMSVSDSSGSGNFGLRGSKIVPVE